ncbi:MAG: hypothetical protein HZA88_04135 [Verrucomicrobia bacterium]|nr:hypothetical protein [Verrucomicrobiota bacterium]
MKKESPDVVELLRYRCLQRAHLCGVRLNLGGIVEARPHAAQAQNLLIAKD